jgi:hypothetical protein
VLCGMVFLRPFLMLLLGKCSLPDPLTNLVVSSAVRGTASRRSPSAARCGLHNAAFLNPRAATMRDNDCRDRDLWLKPQFAVR